MCEGVRFVVLVFKVYVGSFHGINLLSVLAVTPLINKNNKP